jgi:hypothetical protein
MDFSTPSVRIFNNSSAYSHRFLVNVYALSQLFLELPSFLRLGSSVTFEELRLFPARQPSLRELNNSVLQIPAFVFPDLCLCAYSCAIFHNFPRKKTQVSAVLMRWSL